MSKEIDSQSFVDNHGELYIAEYPGKMPFVAKRFFFIKNVRMGESRGNHANKNSQFFMVCIQGECEVVVDTGGEKQTYNLDDSSKGLHINRNTWKTMSKFSEDAILLVLSDCNYDKDEYINDYNLYLSYWRSLNE